MKSDELILNFSNYSQSISFSQIEGVSYKKGWIWYSVRISLLDESDKAVFGLSRPVAENFVDCLECTRAGWWEKELKERDPFLRSLHAKINQLDNPSCYTKTSVFSILLSTAYEAISKLPKTWPNRLVSLDAIKKIENIRSFVENSESYRIQSNNIFVKNELIHSKDFFDSVEARPLTYAQRKAVIVDEDNNLIVAAAGSGKTSVIVAKAGWLIKKGYRKPSEILLLAYAKDAQKEMQERVSRRFKNQHESELFVRTFHALGMSIIGDAEGKRPTLAKVAEDDRALFDLLKSIISDLSNDPKFSKQMVTWFQEYSVPYKSETDFENQGEYWEYVKSYEIRSLKGEKLRSFEECEIANFLFLNGIKYEYERPYEYQTATENKVQYRPDFYLPDSGIYIEHFALSITGETPPFINQDEYHDSMQWKLDLHAIKGTTLISTFSHEKSSGQLTQNLHNRLKTHNVQFSPIPVEEVFRILKEQGLIDPFTRLIATFLQHFKGAQLSKDDLANRAACSSQGLRARAFADVFYSIFEKYEAWLAEQKQIDFHDMIVRATKLVESGRYINPYTYILVDEFQDISQGRARLLKALLERSPGSQLFAVGDDWQAIYRFAGSDIAIMREFSERFGASERTDLNTTFRCSEEISSSAMKFILKNPAQLRKEVNSVHKIDGPGITIGMLKIGETDLLAKTFEIISADAVGFKEKASVLILGRYKHSCPKNLNQLAKKYPNLQTSFMTVHRSKGLEADYVVVAGLCSGKYAFPTEISDDPLLDMVLATPEGYKNAEERRLFYVAMTRARRHVFLLADAKQPSSFVKELLDGEYNVRVLGTLQGKDAACPICVTGTLTSRKSHQNVFFGCSNFPYCQHTRPACPHCSIGLLKKSGKNFCCKDCEQTVEGCPQCEGWLIKRKGKHGLFYGCSLWPDCTYTRSIPA